MSSGSGSDKAARPVAAFPVGLGAGMRSEDGILVFRGLPYAQAPKGKLRWAAPVPIDDWQGVRDAAKPGFACVQPARRKGSIYDGELPETDEDCLSLDIWAPENASGLPVFVWIHGGSLIWGAGSEPVYDGAELARRGMVVVCINYRLGVFGYLAHPELSAASPDGVSGNYGLLDQIEALRWIRRNIETIGGDPLNVTIAGESAGGFSVLLLMAAPPARGLFKRAIAQSAYLSSAPQLRGWAHGEEPAETCGLRLAEALGVPDLATLRSIGAQDLADGAAEAGFAPTATIDGHLLPRQIVEIFDRGEQAPASLLIGYTSGEVRSLRFIMPTLPETSSDYEAQIRVRYGDLADRFLALYPASLGVEESMLAAVRDGLFGWCAIRLANAQMRTGADAYLYRFDHGYPAAHTAGLHGFHGAEIPYIFGSLDRTPPLWPDIPVNGEERRFSIAMGDYWASFAATGQPEAAGHAAWPAYGSNGEYMDFANRPRRMAGGLNEAYTLHDEVVRRRRTAGDVPWNWNVGVAAPL